MLTNTVISTYIYVKIIVYITCDNLSLPDSSNLHLQPCFVAI